MGLPDTNIARPGAIHLMLSISESLLLLCRVVPSDLIVTPQVLVDQGIEVVKSFWRGLCRHLGGEILVGVLQRVELLILLFLERLLEIIEGGFESCHGGIIL